MATAFTFGAFGDFVSVVEIVVRGLRSLSASTGSSYDYQCLIQELLALRRILQILAAATLTNVDVVTVDGLIAEVEYCHAVVERVWEGIRKYNKALGADNAVVPGRRGVVARVKSGFRAVEWELFKKQAVLEARKKLNEHVGRLNIFINSCNLSRLNAIWEHDGERSSSIRAVATQVKELTVIMRQRPGHVDYDSYSPADGAMFDLFGDKCIFPRSLCGSTEQIQAIVALLFTSWPKYWEPRPTMSSAQVYSRQWLRLWPSIPAIVAVNESVMMPISLCKFITIVCNGFLPCGFGFAFQVSEEKVQLYAYYKSSRPFLKVQIGRP